MQTKAIVVLANSVKRSGRCLAGKEAARVGNVWKIGKWVRPVSTGDGGEIAVYSMKNALGHDPQLLEVVEIPFEGLAPLPDQPENWLIQTPLKAGSWKSLGKLTLRDMPALLDKPAELWHDPKGDERRVREGFPRKMPQPASLYLIRPDKIESIEVWSESNTYPGATSPVKRKRVLTMRYAGVRHECDIDDPLFAEQYFPKFPSVKDATMEISLTKPGETFICVSLTGSYHGHHYKIAAAFFEPQK